MNKVLQIALMLTAVDQMSKVVQTATGNVESSMKKIKAGYADVLVGISGIMSAKALYDGTIRPVQDAITKVQNAHIDLRETLMQDGSILNEGMYARLNQSALMASDAMGVAQAGVSEMQNTLLGRGVDATMVADHLTKSMSEFAAIMNTEPQQSGKFVSGLIADWKLQAKDTDSILDLVEKAHHRGLGGHGADALENIQESMKNAAPGYLANGIEGFNAARDYLIMSMSFLNKNLDPNVVGTSFRKIQDLTQEAARVNKSNDILHKYLPRVQMHFTDQDGKPVDTPTMLKQFDLLKTLTNQQRNEVLAPLVGGKNGLSGDILKMIANDGSDAYNRGSDVLKHTANNAELLREEMSKLSRQQAINDAKWENTKAVIGNLLLPAFIDVINKIGAITAQIRSFVENHPKIAKFAMAFIALTSAIMAVAGVAYILMGVWAVLNAVFIASPIGLVILGVTALALFGILLYKNWSKIGPFFSGMWAGIRLSFSIAWDYIKSFLLKWTGAELVIKHWDGIKTFFSGVWDGVKTTFKVILSFIRGLLWDWTPAVMIYNNWGAITAWFHNIFASVKKVFIDVLAWMLGLGVKWFEAGKNIIMSIVHGIENVAHKVYEKVAEVAKKIRDFFPFSPAKEGALRDIHKIRLIETIAEGITPKAMLEKMRSVTGAIFNYSPVGMAASNLAAPSIGGGPTLHINFSPVYNAKGNGFSAADKAEWLAQAKQYKSDLMKIINDEMARSASRKY